MKRERERLQPAEVMKVHPDTLEQILRLTMIEFQPGDVFFDPAQPEDIHVLQRTCPFFGTLVTEEEQHLDWKPMRPLLTTGSLLDMLTHSLQAISRIKPAPNAPAESSTIPSPIKEEREYE